ncbi:hypothetical protein BN2475_90054 [Paraburkholderia ribeironis]|uniref:Uncharacterized protein n=1 Tax=Paraburkholderia ribeironis TaxID=1247936 RepID=A0A1N7RN71_9BURK|nr:hypothetical protein BN2475_90054 [Paraburkholderia ribeironis]
MHGGFLRDRVELVAVAVHRCQAVAQFGAQLQFAAHARNVGADGTRPYVAATGPDGLENMCARYRARQIVEQQQGEAEFLGREDHGHIAEADREVSRVECIAADHIVPPVGRPPQARAAHQRFDPGQHFRTADRFAQAVVGTGMKCSDDLAFARRGHHHDDRQAWQDCTGVRDHVFGGMIAGPAGGDQKIEELVHGLLQERGAGGEVPAHMSAGEDQPVDQFGVSHVRLDEGDSHGAVSAWQRPGNGFFREACSLPNTTPAPKLNRYAESAVLNFFS